MSRPETRLQTRTKELNGTVRVATNRKTETNQDDGDKTTSHSGKSLRSAASVVARKKAELTAAKKIAELQKVIIEKELELEIAELSARDENSIAESHHSSLKEQRTENWVYSQQHKSGGEKYCQDKEYPNNCHHEKKSSESDIKMLARQLKEMNRPSKDLPIFSGHVNEWLLFKSAYDRCNRHVSSDDEDNFTRLQRCLRGDARETVASLLQVNAPASEIIEALELRYGRIELILHEEIKTLKELPKVHDSSEQLCKFACKVRNCVATIKALNKPEQLNNIELIQAIKTKISYLKSDWLCYAKQYEYDDRPELVKLSDFIQMQATALTKFWIPEPLKIYNSNRVTNPHKTFCVGEGDDSEFMNMSKIAQGTSCVARNPPPSYPENTMCPYCQTKSHKEVRECEGFKSLPVDERWNWAKEVKYCFKCLRSRHRRENCRAKPCGVTGCRMSHNRLLHSPPRDPQGNSTIATEEDKSSEKHDPRPAVDLETPTVNLTTCNKMKIRRTHALLQVLPVEVRGPSGIKKTFALLDGGSTLTLLKDDIAKQIGVVGEVEPLSLSGVNATSHEPESRRIDFEIIGPSNTIIKLQGVRTVKNLPLRPQTLANLGEYDHLRDLPLDDICYERAVPELLIGQDNWHAIVATKIKSGKSTEPIASLTALGWVIHGYVSSSTNVVNFVGTSQEIDYLRQLIEGYFRLESIGLLTTEKKLNKEDERALRILETTTKRIDNGKRWEVGLLWREDEPVMPHSYSNAIKRLRLVEKKMDTDIYYGLKYKENMDRFINSGYASRCEPTESPKKFYLPHFGVTNVNKPGKLRIVHDASCKVQGTSLNDKLLTGPDLLLSLLDIIFKFREGKYAVSADIKEMFSQVRIRPEDRAAQRFLWRDFDRSGPILEYEMNSVIFGATCSPATAIYVMRRNAHDYATEFPEAEHAINTRFYMDDYLHSFHSEDDALKLVCDVSYVNIEGGFELTQWMSNSQKVIKSIAPEKRGSGGVDFDTNIMVKTLGLRWNPSDDTLGFNFAFSKIPENIINGTKIPTKRQVLTVIMSLFDPLGLLAPILIQGKKLFQKIVRNGLDWDRHLQDGELLEWRQWIQKLTSSCTCRVPRHYYVDLSPTSIELHTFCDASQSALAAVSYWKLEDENGKTSTCLIASKCKVTPMKPVSIPRLELEAALLGAKLAAAITAGHDTVKPLKRYFWTDSSAVAAWIRGDPRKYKTFVANRLGILTDLTISSEWRWLPTALNVADDATREVKSLAITDRWFTGPEFLLGPPHTWPADNCTEIPNRDLEEKINSCNVTIIQSSPYLPDIQRFSKWQKLIRATAYVLHFIEATKQKTRSGLQIKKLESAENLWIKQSQAESFSSELMDLTRGNILKRGSKLYKLAAFIDKNGILRLKGRVNASDFDQNKTSPVILHGKNVYTKLLLQHYHEIYYHGNRETIVNLVRLKYWIIHLRPSLKTIQQKCQTCRVRNAKPFRPEMGDLPPARLAHHQRPFTHCGLDYFGPMTIAIGRRREKRYGAIFTCMTTRAVHIELAGSLTTDSAILALRRMMAQRGKPEILYSDNGTNLRGANTELKNAIRELENSKYKDFLLNHRIDWHFIPPASPHMGGCWERLIRSIKKCLAVALKETAPSEEILLTILKEAEHTVNARPLTYVSVSPDDKEAITPNHFLLGSSSGVTSPGIFTNADLCNRKYWRRAQSIADTFWRRWVREYMPTLIPRAVAGTENYLKLGDVVVIADPDMPRNIWPRGIIQKVYPGPDGRVRVADVRTLGGVLRRPVVKLARIPVLDSE